jgi:hypothetical protein
LKPHELVFTLHFLEHVLSQFSNCGLIDVWMPG